MTEKSSETPEPTTPTPEQEPATDPELEKEKRAERRARRANLAMNGARTLLALLRFWWGF